MNPSKLLRTLALAAAPLLALPMLLVPRIAHADDAGVPSVTATQPLDAHAVVVVEAFSGSVHVTGWARPDIQVDGAASFNVDSTRARVSAGHSDNVELHVPRASALEIRGISGDVLVTGVGGTVRVETISGDIVVRGDASEIFAHSTAGSVTIEAQAATQRIRARSTSGDVHVRGGRGAARLESLSGDCSLGGGPYAQIEIRSTAGGATFDGQLAAQGSVEMRSQSGEVKIVVPGATTGDFDLASVSGDLESTLGGKRSGQHNLRFKLGTSGPQVRASSFSGDVRVDAHR